MERLRLSTGVACIVVLCVIPTAQAPVHVYQPAGAVPVGHHVAADDERVSADPFRIRGTAVEIGQRVFAHAILVKSMPEREVTVTDVSKEVLLIFNDAVGEEFLALAVIDESGKRVDNHDARLDFTDRSHLRATISKLQPGR